jgi:GT2 family glycosyltransferase
MARTPALPSVSVVILTQGTRPAELAAALAALLRQRGPEIDLVVIGNGSPVSGVPSGVRVIDLDENLGIPAGRNVGVRETTGDIVAFLDDDGVLLGEDALAHLVGAFAVAPDLGIVSMRIADPEGGPGARRHVPRLGSGDPLRSGEVTLFLGGACAIRRSVFDDVGMLPERFFYGHEEIDFAWRAIDAGWRILYDADLVLLHPSSEPTRHAAYHRLNARNRVWLARRRLPWPLVPVYVGTWAVVTATRTRDPEGRRAAREGFAEGWRTDPGERAPIRWRTVWRMTRLGRPPVV